MFLNVDLTHVKLYLLVTVGLLGKSWSVRWYYSKILFPNSRVNGEENKGNEASLSLHFSLWRVGIELGPSLTYGYLCATNKDCPDQSYKRKWNDKESGLIIQTLFMEIIDLLMVFFFNKLCYKYITFVVE